MKFPHRPSTSGARLTVVRIMANGGS